LLFLFLGYNTTAYSLENQLKSQVYIISLLVGQGWSVLKMLILNDMNKNDETVKISIKNLKLFIANAIAIAYKFQVINLFEFCAFVSSFLISFSLTFNIKTFFLSLSYTYDLIERERKKKRKLRTFLISKSICFNLQHT
jgi:hypothetical protein